MLELRGVRRSPRQPFVLRNVAHGKPPAHHGSSIDKRTRCLRPPRKEADAAGRSSLVGRLRVALVGVLHKRLPTPLPFPAETYLQKQVGRQLFAPFTCSCSTISTLYYDGSNRMEPTVTQGGFRRERVSPTPPGSDRADYPQAQHRRGVQRSPDTEGATRPGVGGGGAAQGGGGRAPERQACLV